MVKRSVSKPESSKQDRPEEGKPKTKKGASRRSAGLLLYRRGIGGGVEVFLVHPGGPFWQKKDDGAWSIPKGEIGEQEDALDAAHREFLEETGLFIGGAPSGRSGSALRAVYALRPVRQAGGKEVLAWAVEADVDAGAVHSNTFSIEWPPHSGKKREFPEIDRARWFPIEEGRRKILAGQRPFLDELGEAMDGAAG